MKSPIDTSKDNVAMGIMTPDTELISMMTASAIFCANSPALIGSGADDITGSKLKANIINQLLLFGLIVTKFSGSTLFFAIRSARNNTATILEKTYSRHKSDYEIRHILTPPSSQIVL
jgi:hypothetical protein